MKQRSLNDFSKLLDLFLASTDVGVRDVRLVLDLHHRDCRVDFRRQRNMDLVLVAVDADSHAFFDIGRCHRVGQIDDKLGELLHVDDVFGIICVGVDNLCATSDLQGLFILEGLLVGREIPQCRRCQTSVALLDASQFVDLLDGFLDVFLDSLDAFVVLALAIGLQQLNIALVEI